MSKLPKKLPPMPKFDDSTGQSSSNAPGEVNIKEAEESLQKMKEFNKFLNELRSSAGTVTDSQQQLQQQQQQPMEIEKQPEQQNPSNEQKKVIEPAQNSVLDQNLSKISSMFSKLNKKQLKSPISSPLPKADQNIKKMEMDDLKLNEGHQKYGQQQQQQQVESFPEYLQVKFGNEEYDPSKPNDYEELIAERLKFQRQNQQRIIHNSSHKIQVERRSSKRQSKFSSTPIVEEKQPKEQLLQQQQQQQLQQPVQISSIEQKSEIKENQRKGSEIEVEDNDYYEQAGEKDNNKDKKNMDMDEKLLNMMIKQGYKIGSGLGKSEQGMLTPLITKKTNADTAVIVNSEVGMKNFINQDVLFKKQIEQLGIEPTKILLLTNMVTKQDVDDQLRDEVVSECSNYGNVKVKLLCF